MSESTTNSEASAGWFSPDEWLEDAIKWIVESVSKGITGLVETFNQLLFTLPAPGERTAPATWTSPADNWWQSVWEIYWFFATFGFVSLLPIWMLVQGQQSGKRRAGYRRLVRSAVMILGGFFVAAFGLHLGSATSMAIAPSGTEFLSTPGNIAKLGLGVVVGGVLILVKAGVVFIGLLILFLQQFLTYLVVAFWPLFWALMATSMWTARSVGKVGIALYVTLILLKVFQTAVLRFLFELPLLGLETVMTLIATTVGLLVALVGLPYLFAQKVLPNAVMSVSSTVQSAADRGSPFRDRYQAVKTQVNDRLDNTQTQTTDRSTPDTSNRSPGPPPKAMYVPPLETTRGTRNQPKGGTPPTKSAGQQTPRSVDRAADRTRGIE